MFCTCKFCITSVFTFVVGALTICMFEMKHNHSYIIEFGSKLWINLSFKLLVPEWSAQGILPKTWYFNGHPLWCMFLDDDFRRHFVFSASQCMSTVKSSSSTQGLINKCLGYFLEPTLMHTSIWTCMSHYPRHVSGLDMPIFRRKNCTNTASGILALLGGCTLYRLRADSLYWWTGFACSALINLMFFQPCIIV